MLKIIVVCCGGISEQDMNRNLTNLCIGSLDNATYQTFKLWGDRLLSEKQIVKFVVV